MAKAIKLSANLIDDAKRFASIYNRSILKQIEYWSRIGKIVEENQDLSYMMIKDILLSQDEIRIGKVSEYKFDDNN